MIMPRFFKCKPDEDDAPAGEHRLQPVLAPRRRIRGDYGGRGPGDGFGRSASRKNGQRRPILDKTEFGPRSQPWGAVLERRRSRLGGFGQNPHPPRLWALLSFYREGRRGAGSHPGGV